MRLYHGSNVEVRVPRLMPMVRALDFGQAFYLTSDLVQATKWAKTSVLRRQEGEPVVSAFDFDEVRFAELRTMTFSGPTVEWLRFVSRNRNERVDDSDCDIIAGPVANDNTMPVLNLYFKGAYTEDEAIRRLLPQRLRDQYAFKTERAIAALQFVEGIKV